MLIEELIEPAPVHTARLQAQQDRERHERNQAALLAWHVKVFGPTIGPILHSGTPTPTEMIVRCHRREMWDRLTKPSRIVQWLEAGGVDTATFKRL